MTDTSNHPELCSGSTENERFPSDPEKDIQITLHFTDGTTGHWRTPLEGLAKKSPYFAAMRNFREGKEKIIEIADIDHEGFKCILRWHEDRADKSYPVSQLKPARQLIRAYIVADRLMFDCYQEKVVRKMRKSRSCRSITTADLIYARDVGLPIESPLMSSLLDTVGWQWCYNEVGNFPFLEPDRLIMQGGELLWQLLNKFWQAHHHFWRKDKPNMYEYKLQSEVPSSGVTRLIALQKQGESPNSQAVRTRMNYTLRQLQSPQRLLRLDMKFKQFITRGGLLVFDFVRLWVASCRCRLRKVSSRARSPFIEPGFWHVCRFHELTEGSCCTVKWQERCQCLGSNTTSIELAIPKVTEFGTSAWIKEET